MYTHTKKFFLTSSVSIVLFAMGMQSCKKSDVLAEEAEAPVENVAEMKAFLANTTGHTINQVTYSPQTQEFVVDNDGIFTLSEVKDHMKKSAQGAEVLTPSANGTEHRRAFYLMTRTKASNVKIYVHSSVPASWVAALDQAIANWNSTNSLVYVSRTNTTSGAQTQVRTSYSTSSTIATANYPDAYGNAGRYITINTYHNGLSDSKKVFALTHEMGHSFGLTHTDGTFGSIVSGTPSIDPSSIMNSFVLSWSSFTSYDVQAIRTLYPR